MEVAKSLKGEHVRELRDDGRDVGVSVGVVVGKGVGAVVGMKMSWPDGGSMTGASVGTLAVPIRCAVMLSPGPLTIVVPLQVPMAVQPS